MRARGCVAFIFLILIYKLIGLLWEKIQWNVHFTWHDDVHFYFQLDGQWVYNVYGQKWLSTHRMDVFRAWCSRTIRIDIGPLWCGYIHGSFSFICWNSTFATVVVDFIQNISDFLLSRLYLSRCSFCPKCLPICYTRCYTLSLSLSLAHGYYKPNELCNRLNRYHERVEQNINTL